MKEEMEQTIAKVYGNLNNVFLSEENRNQVMEIKADNLTEDFFIASLIAFKMQFEALTHDEKDIIEFTHMLNSLAIQFIMDEAKH